MGILAISVLQLHFSELKLQGSIFGGGGGSATQYCHLTDATLFLKDFGSERKSNRKKNKINASIYTGGLTGKERLRNVYY